MCAMTDKEIESLFIESIKIKEESKLLIPDIAKAGEAIFKAINRGNKILSCGNGGSAGDAQHFTSELVNRFEKERISLAAVSLSSDINTLSAIANDYGVAYMFSKQVDAIGKKDDILIAISTSGNSDNIIKAIESAKQKQMSIIALTGKGGGKINSMMKQLDDSKDIELCVPSSSTARIQEVHLLIIHSLCYYIDSFY